MSNFRPAFEPVNSYSHYIMNKFTQNQILHFLIELAQAASSFSVTPLFDSHTDMAAIIVVEVINERESTVVLVETCHLPFDPKSLQFWLIKSFMQTVFKPEKTIFSWDDTYGQLLRFVQFGLFTESCLDMVNIVDVRREYLQFDLRFFQCQRKGIQFWSLEQVIGNLFNEFIDQPNNERIWSQGFYQPERRIVHHPALSALVQYAVDSCLAVTKLVHFIRNGVIG